MNKIMDKTQIRLQIKEILKFVDKPEQFIQKLQEILISLVNKEATKNYKRIIPNTGQFYGVWRNLGLKIRKFV